MKKLIIKSVLVLLAFTFTSCEKEVIVDLETAKPRLVINAPLEWQKGTDGSDQYIKLSLTAGYYEPTVPRVTNAVVQVTDETGNTFNFVQVSTPGTYECHNFIPVLNRKYFLEVLYENEIYTGEEVLYPVVDFNSTSQRNDGGINSEDVEVKAFFTDPAAVANYYLSKKVSPVNSIPEYGSFNDEFFDGNQIFDLLTNADLKALDEITFTLYGVSKRHHEYLVKLLNATGGNPFQPIPGVVKGNVLNTTTSANYPLGYFSVSETSRITHIVE